MLNRFKRYRLHVDGVTLVTPLTKGKAFKAKAALPAAHRDDYKVVKT